MNTDRENAKALIVHAYRRHKLFDALLLSAPKEICNRILNEIYSKPDFPSLPMSILESYNKALWLMCHNIKPIFNDKCMFLEESFLVSRSQDVIHNLLIFFEKDVDNKTLKIFTNDMVIGEVAIPKYVEYVRFNMNHFPLVKMMHQELRIDGCGIYQVFQNGHYEKFEKRNELVRNDTDLTWNMSIDLFAPSSRWHKLNYLKCEPLRFVSRGPGFFLEFI